MDDEVVVPMDYSGWSNERIRAELVMLQREIKRRGGDMYFNLPARLVKQS